MVESLDRNASLPVFGAAGTVKALRAGALFASARQPSASPSPDQVRHAVATRLRRLGARAGAARMAGEFGDHPGTVVSRMSWALATIHAAMR